MFIKVVIINQRIVSFMWKKNRRACTVAGMQKIKGSGVQKSDNNSA